MTESLHYLMYVAGGLDPVKVGPFRSAYDMQKALGQLVREESGLQEHGADSVFQIVITPDAPDPLCVYSFSGGYMDHIRMLARPVKDRDKDELKALREQYPLYVKPREPKKKHSSICNP